MSDIPFETIRPLLVSVDGDDVVRVALEHHTELFVGEWKIDGDAKPPGGRADAAARATTVALGQLTPDAVAFTLEWCQIVPTGQGLPDVAATLVGVDIVGATMRYAGAVVVTDDEGEAAAKSVLDALNRRLGVSGL